MAEEGSFSDLFKVVRGQIEHINNAINQRVVWLVIAQSFFFSGYSILTTGNPEAQLLKDKQEILLLIFPIASLLTVILSYIDIIGNIVHIKQLRETYEQREPKNEKEFPPVGGIKTLRNLELVSPLVLPAVFIIIWSYLLCTEIWK
jgi:hypothetical protein